MAGELRETLAVVKGQEKENRGPSPHNSVCIYVCIFNEICRRFALESNFEAQKRRQQQLQLQHTRKHTLRCCCCSCCRITCAAYEKLIQICIINKQNKRRGWQDLQDQWQNWLSCWCAICVLTLLAQFQPHHIHHLLLRIKIYTMLYSLLFYMLFIKLCILLKLLFQHWPSAFVCPPHMHANKQHISHTHTLAHQVGLTPTLTSPLLTRGLG